MNKKQIREARRKLIYEICLAYYKYAEARYQAKQSKKNARRWDIARQLLLRNANAELRKKVDQIGFEAYENVNKVIHELY